MRCERCRAPCCVARLPSEALTRPRLRPNPLRKQIRLSRAGQLSCPVSCGAVLLGKVSLGDVSAEEGRAIVSRVAAAPASRALSGLTTLQQVLDASAEGLLPPVLRHARVASGVFVEFAVPGQGAGAAALLPATALPARPPRLEDTVVPVCWFLFDPMGGAARRWGALPPPPDPSRPPRPEKMSIRLSRPHAGNVCVVRLLSAENLARALAALSLLPPPPSHPARTPLSPARLADSLPLTHTCTHPYPPTRWPSTGTTTQTPTST